MLTESALVEVQDSVDDGPGVGSMRRPAGGVGAPGGVEPPI